jgi:hypothetical protein
VRFAWHCGKGHKIYPSYDKLMGKIGREAIVGIAVNRLLGRR